MRYTDSGNRSANQALGYWLGEQLATDVTGLRWQSGFFSIDGLSPFVSTLERLADNDLLVRALIGSNKGETVKGHVAQLVRHLRLPRAGAYLGITSYADSFYHPKIYHLCRTDGSQAAYIGSANLTASGVNARHVEAGLLLDSREGDSLDVLNEIAASVDVWFDGSRSGIEIVERLDDLNALEEAGVLASAPPERTSSPGGGQGGQNRNQRPRLQPLIQLPSISVSPEDLPGAVMTPEEVVGTIEAVLVAEISGPGRWQQATFLLSICRSFFQAEPGTNQRVSLYHVTADGSLGPEESPEVRTKRSQNYSIELGAVSGVPYPTSGKPIGIFLRTGYRNSRYLILMPDHSDYEQVSTRLSEMYSGPSHQNKRVIITRERPSAIWPDCPFWQL